MGVPPYHVHSSSRPLSACPKKVEPSMSITRLDFERVYLRHCSPAVGPVRGLLSLHMAFNVSEGLPSDSLSESL